MIFPIRQANKDSLCCNPRDKTVVLQLAHQLAFAVEVGEANENSFTDIFTIVFHIPTTFTTSEELCFLGYAPNLTAPAGS